jgi:signal transduction histidine kinase
LRAQEDERKRVARELHDGIGQSVTAIKFEVENVIRRMSENVPTEHFAPLQSLLTMIQEVVEEVGRIAMDLRPSILDDLGVLATITWLCREFRKTHRDIGVESNLELEENEISDDQKIVVFRILQEALNNVAKHSRAGFVQVSLRRRNGGIELSVQDNGIGFDWEAVNSAGSNRRGLGLASMQERTQLSGGSFAVQTQPGAGTVITASWPGG